MPRERSIASVPRSAIGALALGLTAQVIWHASRPEPQAQAQALPPPPSVGQLEIMGLGEPETLARVLMLWLQGFDNQPGISIPFRELDYGKVIGWLERFVHLDPLGQYPLLAASRLYGEVPVESKQRQMLEFVYEQFLRDPNRRWPWLAHSVYIAKHRLHDLPLALQYARALAAHATGDQVPHWAQQMQVFVLEDMGDIEGAKVLLGELVHSRTLTDPQELRFLTGRLESLQHKETH